MNRKKFFIIIDMQNDFLTGSLKNEKAVSIIPNIKDAFNLDRNQTLIFTKDTHEENYLNTSEGKKLPIEHCIKGTRGHNICEDLITLSSEHIIVEKPTFGSEELAKTLEIFSMNKGENLELTLVGTCTGICVVSNAIILKTKFPEAEINVIENCCACLSEESHKSAIETMRNCQINILKLTEKGLEKC